MSEERTRGRPRKDRDDMSREPTGRAERVPMGGMILKLEAPKRPGYFRRWAADRKTNLQRYLNAGYKFVTDDITVEEAGNSQNSRVSQISGDEMLYLMEIPQKLYDEDQAAKQAELDEIDETLRRGHLTGADSRDVKAQAFYPGSKTRGDIVMETPDGSR